MRIKKWDYRVPFRDQRASLDKRLRSSAALRTMHHADCSQKACIWWNLSAPMGTNLGHKQIAEGMDVAMGADVDKDPRRLPRR